MKLSGIIIAKNAEDLLSDCLKSISFCDEIIVVDGGSTDKTNEIAKKFQAKIISGDVESFAEQRNIGLEQAIGDWVFYIDTDERVSAELKEEILRIISNKTNQYAAYKIKRKNF